jgi:hypothetical protein
MTEHDPPPATDSPPRLEVEASPATRPLSPAHTAEEARRPALALLDRLHAADAITLEERSNGRSAILRGQLDELLVPVLEAETPPPIAGSAPGAQPAGRSIGDHLRAQGVLRQ